MISIIIPVYNVASYLNRCVTSIINQEMTNWECILVDDGSTDGSGEICDHFSILDSRISVIHQKNQGVSIARNRGIKEAKGEFICFVDSDDWVSEKYLSDLTKGLKNESIDMVVTGINQEFSNHSSKTIKPNRLIQMKLQNAYTQVFVDYAELFYGPVCILYKLSIIKDHNLSFPENLSLGEDMLFNLRYMNHIRMIMLAPYANYFYRIQNSNTLMTIYRDDRFFIEYELWKFREEFLKKHRMWNNISQEYMYRQLWGIVYNGIFNKRKPTISYMKKIMETKEIEDLKGYYELFNTKPWIKKAIIRRAYIFFYLTRIIKQLL